VQTQKLLEEYPTPVIPDKLTFAKRLAQCLNPTLPHGTHKIALLVYATLFRNLRQGEDWLNTLPIFCIGLFPFFQNCSIQVKPEFLKIIEENFIISNEILPMIVGLVTSILPGLEEKDELIQKKIYDIFSRLQSCIGERFLTGAVWIAILRTPKVRMTAIQYLMKIAKKKQANKDPDEMTGGDISQDGTVNVSTGDLSNMIGQSQERPSFDISVKSENFSKNAVVKGETAGMETVNRLVGIQVPRHDCSTG
jgi:hypothetical protein